MRDILWEGCDTGKNHHLMHDDIDNDENLCRCYTTQHTLPFLSFRYLSFSFLCVCLSIGYAVKKNIHECYKNKKIAELD